MKISAVILFFALCTTRATTILDYTSSYPFPGNKPLIAVTFASSFTVGAQDIEITSMQFLLTEGDSSTPFDTTGYIFSNSGSQPGVLLGSSHRLFAPGEINGGFYEYAFASPLTLSAETIYWAGFGKSDTEGSGLLISYANNLGNFASYGVTPSLTFCTTLSYPPDGPWGVNAPTQTLIYKLEGSVIPEPSGLATLLMGLGLLFFFRRGWKKVQDLRWRRSEYVSVPIVAETFYC